MFRRFKKLEKIPVLCYHAIPANTLSYLGNDHIALEADLNYLKKTGYEPISPFQLIDFIDRKITFPKNKKKVLITFDDASIMDYRLYNSSLIGDIVPFSTITQKSGLFNDKARPLSFVIASEYARNCLSQEYFKDIYGWDSAWWEESIDLGIFDIGNHGEDHLHELLDQPSHSRGEKGNFFCVDNYKDADQQIRQAHFNIQKLTSNKSVPFFAYPYGHAPDYLINDYFPNHNNEHQQLGAFTTEPKFVTRDTNRWAIPRFVCGHHWKSPEELVQLLES